MSLRWLMLAILLVGCPAGTSDTDIEAPLDIQVEVGSGITEYLPLEDGDTLTMTHGPQGAWHLDIATELSNSPDVVAVQVTVSLLTNGGDVDVAGYLDIGEPLAPEPPLKFVLLAGYEGGTGYFYERGGIGGLEGINQAFVCNLRGKRAEICAAVADPDGERSGIGCVAIRLALDPVDLEHHCAFFPR